MKEIRNCLNVCALAVLLVVPSFAPAGEEAQAPQKSSDELMFEIMDLHSQLVTNEMFLAQAKMVGAYMEMARQFDETKKVKTYSRVLGILSQIKEAVPMSPAIGPETKPSTVPKAAQEEQAREEGMTTYEPGAALLEIFKIDPEKQEIPELPVIRTYWKRDLAYSGFFPLPDRASKVGKNSPYVAKFSFYYEAKKVGKYGFTITHFDGSSSVLSSPRNACKLTIGNVDIVTVNSEPVGQGVCDLKKGFHRVEFLLFSTVPFWHDTPGKQMANFKVEILTPDDFDAVLITKDMMLLKKE